MKKANNKNLHSTLKGIVSGLLSLTLFLGSINFNGSFVAKADTLSDLRSQYDKLQTEQQNLQENLNSMQDKVDSTKEKTETISKNVKTINSQITLLNKQLTTLNESMETTNKQIKESEDSIEQTQKQYEERVCALYEAGSTSRLQLLLASDSIKDFFTRFEMLKVISEHDTNLIGTLEDEKTKLETEKASLEEQKTELEQTKGTIAAKKLIVTAQLNEQKDILNGYEEEVETLSAQKSEVAKKARQTDEQINKEIARLAEERRKQLEEESKKNSGSDSSSGSSTVSDSYVISFAKGLLGTPYVFGSADPRYGLDCSGFIQYVHAKTTGIYLPHSALAMSGYGTAVSKDNLQAGDLVFFRTEGSSVVNHCGIYIGNDQFIAANSGSQMKVAINGLFSNSYWNNAYYSARRLR